MSHVLSEIMFFSHRQRSWFVMLLLSLILGVLLGLRDSNEKNPESGGISGSADQRAVASNTASRPRYRSLGEWQRDVEAIFGGCEARRSHLLGRKETVDSELHLLGVEPPTPAEIHTVRQQVENLLTEIAPGNRSVAGARLAKLIHEYDPYGDEGRRVIQIDVPDEPNGRLTGFTCRVSDFNEITERFANGEMIDLQDLRGYAASYAGMPLTRFEALIAMDDQEAR